jgi:hypothetical protein
VTLPGSPGQVHRSRSRSAGGSPCCTEYRYSLVGNKHPRSTIPLPRTSKLTGGSRSSGDTTSVAKDGVAEGYRHEPSALSSSYHLCSGRTKYRRKPSTSGAPRTGGRFRLHRRRSAAAGEDVFIPKGSALLNNRRETMPIHTCPHQRLSGLIINALA